MTMLSGILLHLAHWLGALWRGVASGLSHVAASTKAVFGLTKSRDAIVRFSKTLSKKPQHVGLAIVEPLLSFEHVANLVVWSVAADIKFISLWDAKGDCCHSECGIAFESLIEIMHEIIQFHFYFSFFCFSSRFEKIKTMDIECNVPVQEQSCTHSSRTGRLLTNQESLKGYLRKAHALFYGSEAASHPIMVLTAAQSGVPRATCIYAVSCTLQRMLSAQPRPTPTLCCCSPPTMAALTLLLYGLHLLCVFGITIRRGCRAYVVCAPRLQLEQGTRPTRLWTLSPRCCHVRHAPVDCAIH